MTHSHKLMWNLRLTKRGSNILIKADICFPNVLRTTISIRRFKYIKTTGSSIATQPVEDFILQKPSHSYATGMLPWLIKRKREFEANVVENKK